jgi:hypothetical protein
VDCIYSGETNKLVVLNIYCGNVGPGLVQSIRKCKKCKKNTGIGNEWNAKTEDWKKT